VKEMRGRKGNIKIQQNMRQLMATLKIAHAAVNQMQDAFFFFVVTG
jgi:histidine ammonia-lyase